MDSQQTPSVPDNRRNPFLQRVPYALGIVIGLYFLWASADLGLGTFSAPGPGLWPSIVAVVLIVCCVFGLGFGSSDEVDEFAGRLGRPLIGVAALSLFILMFAAVGLILSGVVLLLVWFRFLSREPWPRSVVLALGTTAAAYLLFAQLLGAQFPADVIAQLWGGR